MRIKRRREMEIETQQALVIRRPAREVAALCLQCNGQVRMVRLEEAMVPAGASSRATRRRVEAGKLHFTKTVEGLCSSA